MILSDNFSVVGVIPSHLASIRFPRKILHNFYGLPMIEHVRRRALLCSGLSRVIVATCDNEIAQTIRSYGGDVVMTSASHSNGTSRAAEAIAQIPCSHVVLLQGDEPLILPTHITSLIDAMKVNPKVDSWNATGSLASIVELDRHSFVKCSINFNGKIMHCFRRSPFFTDFSNQIKFVRKILGLIAFRRDFLLSFSDLKPSLIAEYESIEQMRIIENNYSLFSVSVRPSLPSVNEPSDVDVVMNYLNESPEQHNLLQKLLSDNLCL